MSSFRFRLARVLDWYEERCRAEEERLQKCVSALAATEQAIAALQSSRENARRELAEQQSFTSSELSSLSRYQEWARLAARNLNRERVGRCKALEEQRVKLREARRQVRLLEKLRERRHDEWHAGVDRELDQLAEESHRAATFHRQRDE
jgi:flagellar export protein FliJ